jgi:hypothetical protein
MASCLMRWTRRQPGTDQHNHGAVAIPLLFVLLLAGCSSSGSSSASTVSATCPTSAEITAAAGTAYPAPKVSSFSGTVMCSYSDPATGANLVIMFSPASGTSASALKIVADSQANAQHVTAAPVSGFGTAAYTFTLADAGTNSSGVATTILIILDGSKLIDITAQATVAQVQAIARYVLAH